MVNKLGASEASKQPSGWRVKEGDREAIEKTLQFDDFKSAFAFMSASALIVRRQVI